MVVVVVVVVESKVREECVWDGGCCPRREGLRGGKARGNMKEGKWVHQVKDEVKRGSRQVNEVNER